MSKEQRRSQRIEIGLSVRIIIRDNKSGVDLAEDVGRISDISRHGLRLTVSQAKIGKYHLFYSFHENEGQTIYLAAAGDSATGAGGLPESLPSVRPVWFDRLLARPDKPFQLGMEFLQDPSREIVEWLQQMGAKQQENRRGGWWAKLFPDR